MGHCVSTIPGRAAEISRASESAALRSTTVAPSVWPAKTGFAPRILHEASHSAVRIAAASSCDFPDMPAPRQADDRDGVAERGVPRQRSAAPRFGIVRVPTHAHNAQALPGRRLCRGHRGTARLRISRREGVMSYSFRTRISSADETVGAQYFSMCSITSCVPSFVRYEGPARAGCTSSPSGRGSGCTGCPISSSAGSRTIA